MRYQLTSYRRNPLPIFHPEFGRFMLEATPGKPWGIGFNDLLDVEQNMRLRYLSAPFLAHLILTDVQAQDCQGTHEP
jgi:hypothetical protein